MMYDRCSIEKSYEVMKEFYQVIKNDENKNVVQTLQYKLCNLKDINNTISRLATSAVIDDIELYEVKSLALLSADVKNILEKISLDKIIEIPDLEGIVKILDPDGLRIATFYIYDSYSEELASLRKRLKEKEVYQEEIYNEVIRIEDEIRAELSEKLRPYSATMVSVLNALADVDINIAKSLQMKEMGLSFDIIMQVPGLPIEEIEKL